MKQIHTFHLGNYYVPPDVENGVCVDIGGNTGQFSLKYKDFFRKIHIYEPQRECYEIIKENIFGYDNITVYDEAVYNESNLFVTLLSHYSRDSGSVAVDDEIIKEKQWSCPVDEKCKTISFIDIEKRMGGYIDYMKIDCETSEYNLLINKDLSRIKYIGIEMHWQMGVKNFESLKAHLLKYFIVIRGNINYIKGYNVEATLKSKFI